MSHNFTKIVNQVSNLLKTVTWEPALFTSDISISSFAKLLEITLKSEATDVELWIIGKS